MKSINNNNYPEWIVDYFDGNLDKADGELLMDFLAANESAFEEFLQFKSAIQSHSLEAEDFFDAPSFDHLKVEVNGILPEAEEQVVAYLENDLSEIEKRRFEDLLKKDNKLQMSLSYYKSTRQEVENILIPDFSSLKKKTKFFTLSGFSYAAASVAAAFAIYFAIPQERSSLGAMAALSTKSHQIEFPVQETSRDTIKENQDFSNNQFAAVGKQKKQTIHRDKQQISLMNTERIIAVPMDPQNSDPIAYIDDYRSEHLVRFKNLQEHNEASNNNVNDKRTLTQNVAHFFGINSQDSRIKYLENVADKSMYAFDFITGK